ncbi:hypothetical protein I4U23_016442 [Adineta vaga]|nr:hypothetical protein I4U23_016442 [Adineta vaga]
MNVAGSISTTNKRNKLALIIGNNDYRFENYLQNPVNDAQDMSEKLKTMYFDVTQRLNATFNDMKSSLETFVKRIESNDIVLFYFAGHGHQWEDQNYLIPSNDGDIEDETLKKVALHTQEILNSITKKRPFAAILLLDCCRKYHLRHHNLKNIGSGLYDVEFPQGLKKIYISSHFTNVLIAFPCAEGQIASDMCANGRNSLFTWYLLQHIAKPDQDIAMILRDVARDVQNETMDKLFPQVPWINCSLKDRNIVLCSIFNSQPEENEINTENEDTEELNRALDPQLQINSELQFGDAASTEIRTMAGAKSDVFESRYATDYQTIKVLGKGGFGYVFEAINKLDGRRLAVKRISFKNEREQKMAIKEVRALVRLDHPYIIPYYHTWIENPPVGWQRQEDKTYDWRDLSRATTYATTDSEAIKEDTSNTTDSISRTTTTEEDDDICFEESSQKTSTKNTNTSHSLVSSIGVQPYATNRSEMRSSFQTEENNSKIPAKTSYLYYSMKLCEGESLEQRLNLYNLTEEQSCNIVQQIAEGIAYIHGERLIHCDIKPANIFFSAENFIKIGDFGLVAELLDNNEMEITNRTNQGTHWYIAPELRKKERRISCDEKVDIYAMGIVFLEVLAPFKTQSERYSVLDKIRKSTEKNLDITPILKSYEKAVDFHLSYESIILWLLKPLASERPRAKDLLNNETFRRLIKGIHVDRFLTSATLHNQIHLKTPDIAHGCFDCSQEFILLYENYTFGLFHRNGEYLCQWRWNQNDYKNHGFIAQIVWSTYLNSFLILSNRALFSMEYSNNRLIRKKHGAIYASDEKTETRLRFITCGSTDDYLFLNRGYHTIQQYKMTDWTRHREWSKINLNYKDNDEIRDMIIDRNGEYLVLNVRENGNTWSIDIRFIDDKLTQRKRIDGFHHKLQMFSPSSHWLFVRGNPNKLYLCDVLDNDGMAPREVSFGDNEEDPRFSFSKIAPIHFRWMGPTRLLLGTVIDNYKKGLLNIYNI